MAWLGGALVWLLSATSLYAQPVGPAIDGTVRYYSNLAPVAGASIQLLGSQPGGTVSDAGGAYALGDPGPGDWRVEPLKNGDTNAAISALDAAHLLQAVVGLREFTPLQRLACDVTGDGTVSPLDAARILQYVAGMRSRFPAAENCGSDWVFVPNAAAAPNQVVIDSQMAPSCVAGAIAYEPLVPPVSEQGFLALLLGDCTGNWQPAAAVPTETPTAPPLDTSTPTAPPTDTPPPASTSTATATFTATATSTGVPSTPSQTATPSRTGTVTSTATRTLSPTRTSTETRTATPTQTPTWTRTITATPTTSATATTTPTVSSTVTRTFTPSSTPTRTPSYTVTATFTATITPTATNSATATGTWTGTPTRTGTRTATPSLTATQSPTATATCANGLNWGVSAPIQVSSQGGNLWLAKTVPTDLGWGIFWLTDDPNAANKVVLMYAHLDFNGQITNGPVGVISIQRLTFRGRYFLAAWNEDHFGVLISDNATLFYYNMTIGGGLSGKKAVGPPLFVDPNYDQESDGDLDAFPGGFIGVIEGECVGHSCAYAFKLDSAGNPLTPPINLVDFDFTHQFYPRSAFDGAGFAIISVKDITIPNGGVLTKYLPLSGAIGSHAKVVPAKEYLWDEFPDIAWNGDHFAAIWTENSARSHQQPWQIHFASFRRTKTVSTLIGERIIDVVAQKTNHRWTTQVHPLGNDWLAQYATRAADNSVVAVYEVLSDDATTRAAIEPFTLSADALGSAPHFAPGHAGEIGIARGSSTGPTAGITFYTLGAPACN